MKRYIPKQFEEKWAKKWLDDGLFQGVADDPEVTHENKKYLLYAFAYPSGSGLHVGHVEPVTALDILARYYRAIGKKVFFPVGWDAFGLPAENYAIKTGIPPVKTTKDAIDNFSRQIKRIGVSYDWKTEVATCHPGYYKWTQWLFLQLYKKGFAYKKAAPVNWCPSCQTVLANEQVVEGKCERCGTEVIQKNMSQWFFKITKYAEELDADLDQVDWPNSTKEQQRNWIGKSVGAEIIWTIQNPETKKELQINTFTTRFDTIPGPTFLVIAPEHEKVSELITSEHKKEVDRYIKETNSKTDLERQTNKEKTGVFTGSFAVNPFNDEKIPVYIADYVLASYGTGAVMGMPGHDQRDFEFATKFNLPVKYTLQPKEDDFKFPENEAFEGEGYQINSGEFDGLWWKEAKEKIIDKLVSEGKAKRVINYRFRDWLVSRQRYWGAPIPIVYDPQGKAHAVKEEHLPWMLPTDVDFKPTGESPLKISKEFKDRVEKLYGKGWTPEYDTMDTFVDSSWYYLRYTDSRNEEEFARKEQLEKFMPVDFYMIGPEHIVLHLLYSRFFTKFLRDEGYLQVDEPFMQMRHQGMILGPDNRKMSKSKGNVINPDDIMNEFGADTLRMYEMFMGPINADKPWSQTSVFGVYRFLKRVWKFFNDEKSIDDNEDEEVVIKLQKTIQQVSQDTPELKFNTAIAAMMEFINVWENKKLNKDNAKKFLQLVSPFAPFMTEEIWQNVLREKESIHMATWPQADKSKLHEATIQIPVQINGKVRGLVEISAKEADKDTVVQKALEDQKVSKYTDGNKYEVIYVPNRILNFIVK